MILAVVLEVEYPLSEMAWDQRYLKFQFFGGFWSNCTYIMMYLGDRT
jgi:hypothetical protein